MISVGEKIETANGMIPAPRQDAFQVYTVQPIHSDLCDPTPEEIRIPVKNLAKTICRFHI